MTIDPIKPTRQELSVIFPNQRILRAFEKVFDLIPSKFTEVIEDERISESSVVQHSGAVFATEDTDALSEGTTNLYHTSERAQDAAWGVLGGAQTGISVVYNDAAGTVDFAVTYVVAGDIETTGAANGLIMESPDGTRWRVTVDDTGVLNTAAV